MLQLLSPWAVHDHDYKMPCIYSYRTFLIALSSDFFSPAFVNYITPTVIAMGCRVSRRLGCGQSSSSSTRKPTALSPSSRTPLRHRRARPALARKPPARKSPAICSANCSTVRWCSADCWVASETIASSPRHQVVVLMRSIPNRRRTTVASRRPGCSAGSTGGIQRQLARITTLLPPLLRWKSIAMKGVTIAVREALNPFYPRYTN